MNMMLIVFLLLVMIPVLVTVMFMPNLTRMTESFGVSIPEEVYHSSELKLMRKKYTLITGIIGALTLVLFLVITQLFGSTESIISLVFGFILITLMISSFIVYLFFHQKMKTIKAKEGWAQKKEQRIVVDTRFRDQLLIYSNLWFLVPFVIVALTIVLTFWQYNQIPEQIPMRYNFDGEVTKFTEKSYRSVLLMPIMQVYLIVLFLFINTVTARAKQQVNPARPEESMYQSVTFRRRWSLFTIITGTALIILFSFIQLSFFYPFNPKALVIVPLIFSLGGVIAAVLLSFSTGQGGSRLKSSFNGNESVMDRDDDRYWKLGQFYFNRNDPALFLEKRFGIGWTINLARPVALILLLVVLIVAIGLPLLLGA